MKLPRPSRGDVWLVNLDPTRGHEQAGTRPALVVSVDELNHGPAGLAIVVPLTTKQKGIATHVRISPSEGGLKRVSFAKCEDLRSVSTERLVRKTGAVTRDVMAAVEYPISAVLGL
jgi:mRNA interferase MazF